MKATLVAMIAWLVAVPAAAQIRLGPTDDVEGMLNALSPVGMAMLSFGVTWPSTCVGSNAARPVLMFFTRSVALPRSSRPMLLLAGAIIPAGMGRPHAWKMD